MYILAQSFQIDLSKVHGTGRNGQILKEDILKLVEEAEKKQAGMVGRDGLSLANETQQTASVLDVADKTVPLRGYDRTMLKTMTAANHIPHFTLIDEIAADVLLEVKNSLNETAKNRNMRLTLMPILIKAVSVALKEYPKLNCVLDESQQTITLKALHNIGVAMDTADGLVVPNIKDCGHKSIWEIADQLALLVKKSRGPGFVREDLKNGTFTISNIGSALPRFNRQGDIEKKQVLTVAYSADHRIIDGATLTRFASTFKNYLENISLLLAQLK
ncbi:unnamed protein product [Soboliphyme baturini]|uniref:Peripheral subunit-binding (PSBD) domain-containing protein n=1 Tax=Soboliphyme baturini TaxID=241478 RepID=A0A183IXX3_9BILA|nr:unnamed protein product [Soboliphyme baturini]